MKPSIFDPYDPLLGIGSHLPRRAYECTNGTVYLPDAMFESEHGSLLKIFERRMTVDEVNRLREPYDAEYTISQYIKIQNKQKKIVPFVANYAQRMILSDLEEQRFKDKRIEQDDPKGRQLGITTVHVLYAIFLAFFVRKEQNTTILLASLQNDAGRYQKKIIEGMIQNSKLAKGLKSVEGSQSVYIVDWHSNSADTRQIMFLFGTSRNPEGKSGITADIAIIDEVGKMKTTQELNPKDFVTNLTSTVPLSQNCALILLGTSKEMVNNYWQGRIERAELGRSNATVIFTGSQHDIAQYKPFESDEDRDLFLIRVQSADFLGYIDNMYLKRLLDQGESLEFLHWYDSVLPSYDGHQVMMQEHPTSISEMFVRVEGRYFNSDHTDSMRKECIDPMGMYEIGMLRKELDFANIALGAERIASSTFTKKIHHARIENKEPLLKVWSEPNDFPSYVLTEAPIGETEIPFERLSGGRIALKQDYKILRRYVLVSDPSKGRSEQSSNGCGVVFDTLPLLYNRPIELVAEWHGRVGIREFGWEQVGLAYHYNKAYWVIERNLMTSIDKLEADGEDGSSLLFRIAESYRKVGGDFYRPKDEDGTIKHKTKKGKVGFWTDAKSRPNALQALESAIEETHLRLQGKPAHGYVERCIEAVHELENFVFHADGKPRAAHGFKDDRVLSRAIGLYVIAERRKRRKVCKITKITNYID